MHHAAWCSDHIFKVMCPTQWATLNEPWTAMFQTWQPATSTYVVFKSSAGYNWCTGIVKHVAANIFAHYVCADVTRELRATVMSPFFTLILKNRHRDHSMYLARSNQLVEILLATWYTFDVDDRQRSEWKFDRPVVEGGLVTDITLRCRMTVWDSVY